MKISGKLVTLLPVETGQGKNGTWTKQPFIIETIEQYPKKICIEAWNDIAKTIQDMKPYSTVDVSISIESREWNGRWYTGVRGWKIEITPNTASADEAKEAARIHSGDEPLPEDENQDLPF